MSMVVVGGETLHPLKGKEPQGLRSSRGKSQVRKFPPTQGTSNMEVNSGGDMNATSGL